MKVPNTEHLTRENTQISQWREKFFIIFDKYTYLLFTIRVVLLCRTRK